ncbi:DotU family type IV/VI secretion system protein [Rubrivirga sp.]|uniref:DotU family type IV/VI secretion system protein n=1 Tax=Rubrivirga sp. TaxID=1885344 RepID=UPI003B52B022
MPTTADAAPPPSPDVAPAASSRLATYYGEPIALAVQLQTATEFGPAEVLRERTRRLLRQAERDAQDGGYDRDDTREATFAVVAFLDETIQGSTWSDREQWLAQPLQLELYDRNDAGEEFFTRLDTLRGAVSERADVLEVYYLCLALGFRGRYEFLPPGEHRDLVAAVYGDLARAPTLAPGPLAPNAEPAGRVVATVRRRVPAWAVLAACAAVAVVVYASLAVYARTTAGAAIAAIERETETAITTGPAPAAFGAAPVDPLSDTTAVEEDVPEPEPVEGFPPSDALPEPPPELEADPADAEEAEPDVAL